MTEWNDPDSLPTTSGTYDLMVDVTLTETWTKPIGTVTLSSSSGHKIISTVPSSGNTSTMYLRSGTLNLDCEVERNTGVNVCVENAGGTVVLQSNCNIHRFSRGVLCTSGTLRMEGGTLDCSLDGIYANGGTVRVSGGTITGSTDGIAIYAGSGSVTGGTITGCSYGAYMPNDGCSFSFTGGSITGNTSAGIYVRSDSTVTFGGTAVLTGNTKNYDRPSMYHPETNTKASSGAFTGTVVLDNKTAVLNSTFIENAPSSFSGAENFVNQYPNPTLWGRKVGSTIKWTDGSITAPPVKVKVGTGWKQPDLYKVKVGNAWKLVDALWLKVGNTWKRL